MDKKKVEKIASLIVALVAFCLSFVQVTDWAAVGIYADCGLACRMLYPFFHANVLHAALNAWCLLSIVFIYDISLWRLICSYVVAVTVPVTTLSLWLGGVFTTPTVGLSGMVFFLFASITFEVERKLYYQAWMLFYLAVGFILPNTSAWLHLYCYIVGLFFALLVKPVKI
ncbi:MAG: Rhomboid family protein [Bacteriophage sp.]|nr:MAG: Rhomboid family protein [Bacteriophage sp.]